MTRGHATMAHRHDARLRIADRLSWAIVALASIAAATGLFWPQIYRDETAWVIPQNRGQDLLTLFALALLAPLLPAAARGGLRARLLVLGLLGYLAYTYTAAAMVYRFNALFPIYVALFSLSGAALIAGLSGLDVDAVRNAFDARTPRRVACIFLIAIALSLSALWIAQILPFYTRGELPAMIAQARTPTVFVYVFDLGAVVPVALLAARWLWRDRGWGYVLAGFVMVKATTMGLALLSMTAFALRAGQAVDPTLSLAWGVLAIAGLTMSLAFYRHCGDAQSRAATKSRPAKDIA